MQLFNQWDIDFFFFFWRIATISLFPIRQKTKANMLHKLMIVFTVLSSGAFSSVSKKMRCEIEYKNYRKTMATFYFDFEEKNNLDMSNLTFVMSISKYKLQETSKV